MTNKKGNENKKGKGNGNGRRRFPAGMKKERE
jgi:hypothetical protein